MAEVTMMAELTIDQRLEKMREQCQTNADAWIRGPLDVLCTSYSRAFDRYNQTLARQQAADDLKAEIALTILLAGAGAAITAAPIGAMLMGSAAGRVINRAASRIKTSQLKPFLDAAQTNLANRTVVKAVLRGISKDTVSLLRKKGLASAVASMHSSSGDLTDGHPETLRSVLRGEVQRSFTEVQNVLLELQYTPGHDAEKLDVLTQLESSRLVARNVTSLEPLRATYERRFELILYMDLLMKQDYLVVQVPAPMSKSGIRNEYRSITALPGSAEYPVSRYGHKVHRRDLGGHIEDRINTLYKEELADGAAAFTGPPTFITQSWTREENTPWVMRNGAKMLEILTATTNMTTVLPQPAF
ncbi:hypothetical protein V8J82_21530 [Gymnodinialimonas sp. 2305UL16-5]|uniref:hypothetical protein n=1 Tax=Gymnodinialimonas mytili TaxID=3126503 RepID=UPI00309E0965